MRPSFAGFVMLNISYAVSGSVMGLRRDYIARDMLPDVFQFDGAKNLGASPEAFKNMKTEIYETKPEQASGYQTQKE